VTTGPRPGRDQDRYPPWHRHGGRGRDRRLATQAGGLAAGALLVVLYLFVLTRGRVPF
jgi:hypothetical protein